MPSFKYQQKSKRKLYYLSNKERALTTQREYYCNNLEKERARSVANYVTAKQEKPERQKRASQCSSRKNYFKNLARSRQSSTSKVQKFYEKNKEACREASRVKMKKYYDKNREACREASRVKRKKLYAYHGQKLKVKARMYYRRKQHIVRAQRRNRYALAEVNDLCREAILKNIQVNMLSHSEELKNIVNSLSELQSTLCQKLSSKLLCKTVCKIVASKLLAKVFQARRTETSSLLAVCRHITTFVFNDRKDIGEGIHHASTEPYFYDAAYSVVKRKCIPITRHGVCFVAEQAECPKDKKKDNNKPRATSVCFHWKCTEECKTLSNAEVESIVSLKQSFSKPMNEIRQSLEELDNGCPYCHGHTTTYFSTSTGVPTTTPKLGHPLVCHGDGTKCTSKLRILRCAAVHYPLLLTFLKDVYTALSNHCAIKEIDMGLRNADITKLIEVTDSKSLHDLLTEDTADSYMQGVSETNPKYRQSNIETPLLLEHAAVVAKYEKDCEDFADIPCMCCERLCQRKNVSKISLSDDKLSSEVWHRLKDFVVSKNPNVLNEQNYLCNYCRPSIRDNVLPSRCVLNGLETIPVPPELEQLDALSTQLIQLAKCYQTVVRLGTYTKKVPTYNSLKACKGTMFFLPLPMKKTLETLNEAELSKSFADPEMYIILNGKPTKKRIVWRSLVDINKVKRAVDKLKQINWLYKDVRDDAIDETSKQVIELANSATSTMLAKADEADIAGFQAYTVRNLDNNFQPDSDIDQYKMLSVKEHPIDNRQNHLDLLCFPTLFPTGAFGQNHQRDKKISHAEYAKSRLLNKDSRFRKNAQYVFYLLWQKELRELSAGIYNMLKNTRQQAMTVATLLSQVNSCDEQLEANLSTMLQSVRGTKHYWFRRQSELKCIIRDHGPPTLFLTFSCAEYESSDITEYLKRVNGIPSSSKCNIGKLCIEDPVSVSRQFSNKFHCFFQTVIVKGQVLGKVAQFYWKKEYQARGAPHYHVLLWIEGAPVIGEDKPEHVITWIQERITCHIPNEKSNPELHRLVTRYQMHKCSNYCRRRRKVANNTFITVCKFVFPRPACDCAKLNPVEESLKSRDKIYELVRSETEVRVNDYNPLLLYLWKANIDIQFVAESSLALAHYVSGYVTKAERSNLQDIWEDIGRDKSVYGQLWSFGLRSLRFRECGLYEAADLVLGDHLTEKSCTVKYVDVSLPSKRSHRLKNHKELQRLALNEPNSDEIFEHCLIENYYPDRPQNLEEMCLYDFVKWIDWTSRDKTGKRYYKRLNKPRFPNHKLYDPEREEQREDYYYSLILLFVPFRDENTLLLTNEKAEEAFHRLSSSSSSLHHEKLQKMLKAQSKTKEINKARHESGVNNEKPNAEDDGPQVEGEAKSVIDDVLDISVNAADLESKVAMLNCDQSRVFDNVKDHFMHQKRHEDYVCHCDFKPLQMFISGVGGTGKSFLIETIRALIVSIWPNSDRTCAIAAPTGLAAFNVGGVTVHRLFQLPVEHEGKTAGYWPLSKDLHKVRKTTLRHTKAFIIDEISMVSSLNLAYIHMRLEELFGSDEWFGGRNMLFFGDFLQLQPVNGSPVFERITQKSLTLRLGCATSVNIWRDSVVYDELTINERQKSDKEFAHVLDCVRRGFPTKEIFSVLEKRVINVPVVDKVRELEISGETPVCLFPTRKACDELNHQMLSSLPSEVIEISSTDDIDQTSSTRRWTKKATEHLEKLNKDCNMTAGLEAKLNLAVGARVMLRRNSNTKAGLVNGAIGTVTDINKTYVQVKFDKVDAPYDVERVKSRFMVMKNFFVYRKQFPLILAFAVTIHKCQGLSLDCAVVDLSENVFSAGMAYVALSRVKSISGLHLSALNPNSIMVSESSIREVNRLRERFRKDLPQYAIPPQPKRGTKRRLAGDADSIVSSARKIGKLASQQKSDRKRKNTDSPPTEQQDKSKRICQHQDYEPSRLGVWPFSFNPVNADWQHDVCAMMGLRFIRVNGVSPGGPNVTLRHPNSSTLANTVGDGNCLFRAFSYIITGSQTQYNEIRTAVVTHMQLNSDLFMSSGYVGINVNHNSVDEYINDTQMDTDGAWGSAVEMFTLAHLLSTRIISYSRENGTWQLHSPSHVDPSLRIYESDSDCAMFLYHTGNHFKVVRSIIS